MMQSVFAAVIGVGAVLLLTRKRQRAASHLFMPTVPASSASRQGANDEADWDDDVTVVRAGSGSASRPSATTSSTSQPSSTRTSTTTTGQPSSTRTSTTTTSSAPAAPRTSTSTPPVTYDRQVAATQNVLNNIHAYIASASGRALHPQITVTGRLDQNTFRSWNMLCQTAWGLRNARSCISWFSGYPLQTAWAPYAVQTLYWTDYAAFQQAFRSNTPVTAGGESMTIPAWLVRVYENRTHDNKPMHLDALSDYWKLARQSTRCWRYQ